MAQLEILAVLTAAIAAAHWLGNKPGGRMVGGALLVIIPVAVLAARFMRQSLEIAAVASATTVGGSTVVLPLVERFGRKDLLLPGIVLGSLGNLLGTYIGFMLVYYALR